jgi:ubiquinone/menaquinone biosynthesis C-methylase UbiE
VTVHDQWSRWVLERRDAGSERQRGLALAHLAPVRDRVLDGAEPLEGATLLDVGAGDGLIGLAALDRVGERGTVIFSDVSAALLERCEDAVRERRLLDRARFVEARAEDLAGIDDASVDAVTIRSVLIYVADKDDAFAAFHRVLRPGGRLSIFEPINRHTYPEPPNRFWGYDVAEVADLADEVKATFAEVQDRRTDTMVDFDHHGLAGLAEDAGFLPVHCESHIRVERGSLAADVDTLLDGAPNPLAPTVREGIEQALTGPEQERFIAHLRQAHDDGRQVTRLAVAYLAASKPG